MGAIGAESSSSDWMDAYGQMSRQGAGRFGSQFANPMAYGFGIGSGRRANQFNRRLDAGQYDDSPLGQFIQFGQQQLPQYQENSARLGQEIATRAPELFNQYRGSVQDFMGQLGNYRGAADEALGAGRQTLAEASSPVQSQALYQEALRRANAQSQQGAAGRGMLDSGQAQASEDANARDLGYQFAQSRQANSIAAQQNVGQLAGNATSIASMGPQAQQALFEAYPQLAQLQQMGISLPFQSMQQIQGFLAATQNPTMALVQATAPQIAQESKGWHF